MARIFISYRRDDSAGYVGRLYDRLKDHFGENAIFTDIDTIQPGEDFVEVINKAVGSSDILLAIIGKQWATLTDASGQRRLDDPNDYVRLEIAAALQRNLRVVPVLVRGTSMPRASELPPDLQPLSRRNAHDISDKNFHHDVDELIQALEQIKLPHRPIAPPWRRLAALGLLLAIVAAALITVPNLLLTDVPSSDIPTPTSSDLSAPDVLGLLPIDGEWRITTEYVGAGDCAPLPEFTLIRFDWEDEGNILIITPEDDPNATGIPFTRLDFDRFEHVPDENNHITMYISPDHMEEDFSFDGGNCKGHRVYTRIGDF